MFAISKKSNDYCVIALRYFSTNTKIKLKKFKEITIALLCIKIKTQDMARRMNVNLYLQFNNSKMQAMFPDDL